MSAAILHLAICVRDVMNKTGVCGRSVDDVLSQLLPALRCERASQRGNALRSLNLKPNNNNNKFFCMIFDGTTVSSMQMEMFSHCPRFQVSLSLRLDSPSTHKHAGPPSYRV